MKRKINGFTLVELIAVIAILGIISAVASGLIINSLGKAKDDINTTQESQIIDLAKHYYENNMNYKYDNEKELYEIHNICIQKNLIDEGYLDKFVDDDNKPRYGYVKVSYTNNKFSFKYNEVASKDDEINCVECSLGDVNQDGVIDKDDSEIIGQYIALWPDIREKYGDTILYTGNADDSDDEINVTDLSYILMYNLGHKPCTVSQAIEKSSK